jgi:hypothetical protein
LSREGHQKVRRHVTIQVKEGGHHATGNKGVDMKHEITGGSILVHLDKFTQTYGIQLKQQPQPAGAERMGVGQRPKGTRGSHEKPGPRTIPQR